MARVAVIGGLGVDSLSLAGAWAAALAVDVVNAGDVLRDHLQRQTSFGVRMKAFLDAGDLVPEVLAGEVVLDAIHRVGDEWMLHGWPRTVTQAELLAEHGQQPRS